MTRLIIISADLAGCDEFVSYADSLRARGLLKRIFVNEYHTAVLNVDYKRRLKQLKGLYRYDRPVILLTATLPVRMENWLRKLMLIEDVDIV